jgi:hypothetical protein
VRPLKAKGVNFRGMITALTRRGGKDLADRVLARVPGEAGEALRLNSVVAGGWYAGEWYDQLLRAIEEEHPKERHIVRNLTREAVTDDFSTIFKVISLVVSPEAALRNAAKILARYWDGGLITVVETREGYTHFVFEDFHGFTRPMWADFQGGLEAIIDLMNLEREPFEVRGGGQDGPRLELVLRYRRKAK